jgi:hypothetical protein
VKTWNVIAGVARRTLKNALTNPQILLPTLAFPLFFFTAFAGGLSRVDQAPGWCWCSRCGRCAGYGQRKPPAARAGKPVALQSHISRTALDEMSDMRPIGAKSLFSICVTGS